jgi:hypothetical protein
MTIKVDESRKLHPGLMDHAAWSKMDFSIGRIATSSCNILQNSDLYVARFRLIVTLSSVQYLA